MSLLPSAFSDYALATTDEERARLLHTTLSRALDQEAQALADRLPALTERDFTRLCNGTHEIRAEVERFRDSRWSLVDVSDLAKSSEDGHEEENGETWTILRGSSRFEVRKVDRFEVREGGARDVWEIHDWEDNNDLGGADLDEDDARAALYPDGVAPENFTTPDDLTVEQARTIAAFLNEREDDADRWIVIDTEDSDADARDGGRHSTLRNCGQDDYDTCDESSADAAAEAANVEAYKEGAAGWPFAQNYAAAIDIRDADDFSAAGFVVAEHTPSGQVYAGIDGGGYDLLEAHWCPLFLRMRLHDRHYGAGVFAGVIHAPPCIYVPTPDGIRRVIRNEDAPKVDAAPSSTTEPSPTP